MTSHERIRPAEQQDVPPDPGALIESMRAVGYDLPTAVADLIDNSIAANGKRISVEFDWDGPDSSLKVIDDGEGMSEDVLVQAMRLGSKSPTEAREPHDLGRFGLGLKSAGWSQARVLTVATRTKKGELHIRQWDLDHVISLGTWSLLNLDPSKNDRYGSPIEEYESGTVVTLERMDRMVGTEPKEDAEARARFTRAVASTYQHLSMVFHRFLQGRHAIEMAVNEKFVSPWDPFMADEPATQPSPTETFRSGDGRVAVTPYVLPHFSKLDTDQHTLGSGTKGWNAHQGFYVYRAKRLLVAGGWLNLKNMKQEEHLKLARIQVDIDNTLDSEWQIDVKKETAVIPGFLEQDFRRIAEATRRKASDAYRFRGKTVARTKRGEESLQFVWERVKRRNNHVFLVNRNHPVVKALGSESMDQRKAVEKALRLAEENIPVESIVMESREAELDVPASPFEGKSREVEAMIQEAKLELIRATGLSGKSALEVLSAVEPFDSFPELIQVALEEESNGR